jgi:guanylate kinase
VLKRVLQRFAGRIRMSVSATTRSKRAGEVDGEDYHFLSRDQFQSHREADDFLECVEVFGPGHWYGTLRGEVDPSLAAGVWVILEIDVQGADRILQQYPDVLTIFLRPESEAELERRLRARGTESEDAIRRRLEAARRELAMAGHYNYQVVNDSIDRAVDEIAEILIERGLTSV